MAGGGVEWRGLKRTESGSLRWANGGGQWRRESARWGGPGGVEVWLELGEGDAIDALTILFADADRATRLEDDVFGVTVVGVDGRADPVDFGTAASLTFLREALGCSLTAAASLYARLCAGEASAEWGGARIAFVEATRPGGSQRRPGLEARRRPR